MKKHIPNILTVSRIIMTFFLFHMIIKSVGKGSEYFLQCLIFFVLISATDFLDGYLARKWKVESKFGRVADPFADKVFIVGSFACFAVMALPEIGILSPLAQSVIRWAMAIVIVIRETTVTIVRQVAERKGHNFGASMFGKVKMFSQCVTGGYILLHTALFAGNIVSEILTLLLLAITIFATAGSGIEAGLRLYKAEKAHLHIDD